MLGRNGASVAYPYKTGMLANYGFVGNNYSGFHVFAGALIVTSVSPSRVVAPPETGFQVPSSAK